MRAAVPLLVAAAAAAVIAQVPAAPPRRDAMAALTQGRYLEAVDGLAALATDGDGKPRDPAAFQTWAQVLPFVTGELDPDVLVRAYGAPPLPAPALLARLEAARPRDALAEIVRRARSTNVVVLNEDHQSPRDRAFALEVARVLRPLGYSVFAAEAFSNDGRSIEALARDGFVRLSTGHYTKDPVFAGFVREALALGYRPVAYEQTPAQSPAGSGVAEREQAQAENLVAAVFRREPHAKVLIHVGFSHAAESPVAGGGGRTSEWMAARLKRLTGIDPLTIDQTGLTDLSADQQAYRAVAGRIGARPATLFADGRPLVVGRCGRGRPPGRPSGPPLRRGPPGLAGPRRPPRDADPARAATDFRATPRTGFRSGRARRRRAARPGAAGSRPPRPLAHVASEHESPLRRPALTAGPSRPTPPPAAPSRLP